MPPLIVAVVMVLQRLEGLSRPRGGRALHLRRPLEVRRGRPAFDHPGFAHTVLVDMRARLARSASARTGSSSGPSEVAPAAGLVGVRRVLDSTPLYDAVATMDTVTLVRSAIRGVLAAAGEREPALRLARSSAGTTTTARGQARLRLGRRRGAGRARRRPRPRRRGPARGARRAEPVPAPLAQAATLLATVLGQDLEDGPDGRIRIARRVAHDRVISTVDPEARHGHKTAAHSFDGYKGHLALDPDAELVTATAVTPGNTGDASVAESLLGDMLPGDRTAPRARTAGRRYP